MRTKLLLLLTPLALTLLLGQAYFWVPTYEDQTAVGGERLRKYIEASIADAKLLNPALHADAASGRIVDRIFEGLLDLDQNLALRGRLARDWQVTETAYLLVIPGADLDRGTAGDGSALVQRLRAALAAGEIELSAGLREPLALLPAQTRGVELQIGGETRSLAVRLPPRIRLRLDAVDQDLLRRLRPVLGDDYGETVPYAAWHDPVDGADPRDLAAQLAAKLPVLEHNPEILFQLRRGVRFHDGHEFDAGDVAFTFEAIMDPRNLSPRTSAFEPIARVDVVDRYQVRVTYKRLFSPAVNAWTMGILPEHLLNAQALQNEMDARGIEGEARDTFGLRDSRFNRAPVGTGPFRFVAWQSDELIHLRSNPDYWEGAAQYHNYYYRIIPDALTREVEFRSGAVDSYAPQPYQAARYRDDARYRAFSIPSTGYTYIGYNNRRALFADPRVRRALALAIDVDAIIEYVLYGEGERITGPYPRTTEWYPPQSTPLPYDPQAALSALEALGWRHNAEGWLEKDGRVFEFNLITNNGNQIRRAILSIAQDAWKRIGIKCTTQVFEWAVFLQDFINPGEFDAVILGWQMDVDPDLFQLWHSSQSNPNQLNFVGYSNPRADALIERIRREYDRTRQVALARELHEVIAADQPYTFLFAPRANLVLDRKIVMVAADGHYERPQASRGGDLYYHFNRWRKLEHEPDF